MPLLAGCLGGGTGGQEQTTTTATTQSGPRMVVMEGSAYAPLVAEVETGTTVEWTNEDGFAHTVTSTQFNDGAMTWSIDERAGADETITHTFEESGAFEYYCTIHGESSMCGVVVVGGAQKAGSLPCESDGGSGGGGDGGYY